MKAALTAQDVKILALQALEHIEDSKETNLTSQRIAVQRILNLACAVDGKKMVELDQTDYAVLTYGIKEDATPQIRKKK